MAQLFEHREGSEMLSIELFTGGGGLALGSHLTGFHHLALVERDRNSCDTLRLNHSRGVLGINWLIIEKDVRDIVYSGYEGQIDLFAGGPPCQPFSLGGKHAGDADERNMFPEVFRAVRELRPKSFLLENVKGLGRESFRPYLDYVVKQLTNPFVTRRIGESWREHSTRLMEGEAHADLSYFVYAPRIFNVADFGVPQVRHRIFTVGFRDDLLASWEFPKPSHSEEALLYSQYVDHSYWDEHGLPHQDTPGPLLKRIARLRSNGKPSESRWRTTRDAIGDLPEPTNFVASPQFDNHIGIPDARPYRGHTGSPWDWPAKAIKAGDHGNPGGENILRRDDGSVRYFTVRELARLQTFPDEWHFANSWTESRRQLGNAVPVLVAQLLAHSIHESLVRSGVAHDAQVVNAALAK